MERPRRTNEKSVCARPESVRVEFGNRAREYRRTCRRSESETETDGSIVCPSSANGIAGIYPSVGLVSRGRIIPISHSQDTAGLDVPDGADAAILLGALAGYLDP